MQKKALAINIVIWLVLTLIIIVVLGILLGRGTGTYTKTASCEGTGGKCLKPSQCDGAKSFLPGCEKDEICCTAGGN